MNDFELRRELRELRGPLEPSTDLWPQIARQLAEARNPVAASTVTRRRRWPLALAAGVALAVSAGMLTLEVRGPDRTLSSASARFDSPLSVTEQIERARSLALSGDPRVAGPEVVLDTASEELELALQQRPDAVFLVGLINQTHAQRRKLARLGLDAG